MSDIQDLTLTGFATKVSSTQLGGKPAVKFTLGAAGRKKDPATGYAIKTWYNVTAFGDRWDWLVNAIGPEGCPVMVKGPLEARAYLNKNGEAAVGLGVILNDIKLFAQRSKKMEESGGLGGLGDDNDQDTNSGVAIPF